MCGNDRYPGRNSRQTICKSLCVKYDIYGMMTHLENMLLLLGSTLIIGLVGSSETIYNWTKLGSDVRVIYIISTLYKHNHDKYIKYTLIFNTGNCHQS